MMHLLPQGLIVSMRDLFHRAPIYEDVDNGVCVVLGEGHLIFRNPVPMQFAWVQMKARTGLHIFAELDQI
jgi:hypothetical protein